MKLPVQAGMGPYEEVGPTCMYRIMQNVQESEIYCLCLYIFLMMRAALLSYMSVKKYIFSHTINDWHTIHD